MATAARETQIAFAITLLCEALLGGLLLVSLAVPRWRIWPPPGRGTWQIRAIWSLTLVAMAGTLLLGWLDWNRFVLDHWVRIPEGAVVLVAGLALATWGVHALGVQTTLGLGGRLVDSGPYRLSRNPQYVGDVACFAGWAILSNSLATLLAAAFGSVWFLLAPRVEEPWLRARYGAAYDAHAARVPRFRSLRALRLRVFHPGAAS